MLRKLLNFLYSIQLYVRIFISKVRATKRTGVKITKKVRITQLSLKESDHYKLGESTVTLAKFGIEGKQEVAKKIAAADARRAERAKRHTARAEEIMLIPPDQLLNFQIEEWLEKRKKFAEKLSAFPELTEEQLEREARPPESKTP